MKPEGCGCPQFGPCDASGVGTFLTVLDHRSQERSEEPNQCLLLVWMASAVRSVLVTARVLVGAFFASAGVTPRLVSIGIDSSAVSRPRSSPRGGGGSGELSKL